MLVFPRIFVPITCVRFTRNRRCVPPNDVPQRSNLFFVAVRTSKDAVREWLRPCTRPDNALVRPSQKTRKGDLQMTKSVRLLLMGAALTGFMAGQTVLAQDTGGDKDEAPKRLTAAKRPPSQRKTSMPARDRTPAKAKAAADPPKARMIAKVKANAGQTASPWKKRATGSSYRSSQLKRTGGTPLVLYFQNIFRNPLSLYQLLCPQIVSTDTKTSA